RYDETMDVPLREFTWCLDHQAAEDQMSPAGLVCPECKRRLYTQPPQGPLRTFWESQPEAWTPSRKPCFVYSRLCDDCRVRSLHAAGDEFDLRSQNAPLEMPANSEDRFDRPEWEFDAGEFSSDENGDD